MKILFVCTGNTCRSPLAETFCKHFLAERLECEVSDLPAKGFEVVSAGVAAYPGEPASQGSIAAAAELGVDLTGHRSGLLNAEVLSGCDHLVTVTHPHRVILEASLPPGSPAVELLCGEEDLDDPVGADIESYRACAGTIRTHVKRLLGAWGLA